MLSTKSTENLSEEAQMMINTTNQNTESIPAYVSFLWGCKLYSRGSFLTILEFCNITKPELSDLLLFFGKAGLEFFKSYVKDSE